MKRLKWRLTRKCCRGTPHTLQKLSQHAVSLQRRPWTKLSSDPGETTAVTPDLWSTMIEHSMHEQPPPGRRGHQELNDVLRVHYTTQCSSTACCVSSGHSAHSLVYSNSVVTDGCDDVVVQILRVPTTFRWESSRTGRTKKRSSQRWPASVSLASKIRSDPRSVDEIMITMMIVLIVMIIFRSGTDLMPPLILFLLGRPLFNGKSLKHRRFKSDRDEICQECSSSKFASIDRVGFLIWHHTFMVAAMTSLHAEKCCHLVTANKASAGRLCSSIRQFLIYCRFVFVMTCMYIIRYAISICNLPALLYQIV